MRVPPFRDAHGQWWRFDARARSWLPVEAPRRRRANVGVYASKPDLGPDGRPLPPESPVPCRGREREWLGRMIPGRHGGTVSACATPRADERTGSHRLMVGLPMRGAETLSKSQARERFYPRPRHYDAELAASVGSAARSRIPGPIDYEFPHSTRGVCCTEHPLWKGYAEALARAEKKVRRAQLDEGEWERGAEPEYAPATPVDDVPFNANPRRRPNKRGTVAPTRDATAEAVRAELLRSKAGPGWLEAHRHCAQLYERRERARRERQQHETAAKATRREAREAYALEYGPGEYDPGAVDLDRPTKRRRR